MPKIPTLFEQELRNLAPARLEADFLDRLSSSAEGTQVEMTEPEPRLAEVLESLRPRRLPHSLHSSLSVALDSAPFAVDEKIVLFHGRAKSGHVQSRKGIRHYHLAAAATVALLGAATALFVPHPVQEKTAAVSSPPQVEVSKAKFAPASYGRNLVEIHDEGVFWGNSDLPHRVQRRTYLENMTLENGGGATLRYERPHHEYFVTPEKFD